MSNRLSIYIMTLGMLIGFQVLPVFAQGEEGPAEVDVFVSGENGYASFRIPSIVVAANGDVLAFAEGRVVPHDHAENDIVLRRSSDGGQTWSTLEVVAEMGTDSLNDPNVTVLEDGRVMMIFQRFPEGVHARNSNRTRIADEGYGDINNTQTFIVFSEDHGVTWSTPSDVTVQLRRPETICIGSPGIGLKMSRGEHAGRIVVPFYQTRHLGEGRRAWDVFVGYSDDDGETWQRGDVAPHDLPGHPNECQVVETEEGGLRIWSRHQGGHFRATGLSDDGGETWGQLYEDESIRTPACMGSILRYSWGQDDRPGVMLASLPRGNGRTHGTVLLSEDDGTTWINRHEIVEGGFGYSCLTRLPDGDVGCLYETAGYARITLSVFSIDWIRDQEVQPPHGVEE